MKTRAAMRIWIRLGMPLPEDKYQAPEPDPATWCQVFELRVYPEHKRLTVKCVGCGHDKNFSGLRLHPNDAREGVRTPVRAARDWIAKHLTWDPAMPLKDRLNAGLKLQRAEAMQVEAWAIRELAWIVPNPFVGILAGIPEGPHLRLIQGAGKFEG